MLTRKDHPQDAPARDARHGGGGGRSWARLALALLSVLVLVGATFAAPVQVLAQSAPDRACKAWYEDSPPDEQAREDLEAQSGTDQDKDGCTGILAAPGSQGPVEGAPENPTGDTEGQKNFEEGLEKKEESGPKDCAAWYADETPEEQQREQDEDVYREDDLDGDGCIGEEPVAEGDKVPTKTDEECADQLENDSEEERAREMEEDAGFGHDGDGDGCVGDRETGNAAAPGGAPATTTVNNDPSDDPGGFTGMAVGAFQGILEWLYDKSVTEPTEDITAFLTDEAFDLPDTHNGGLKEKYESFADLVKPGAIPIMLVLGYLMMFQGANYNAAVAAQSSLPKIFLFVVGLGFFPDLADMIADISTGLAKVLVSEDGVKSFLEGSLKEGGDQGVDGALMVINKILMVVILVLVVIATAIKNLVFSVLWVFGPLPMLLWAIPQTAAIAASWARCMAACFALPIVYAAIIGVGTLLAETPSLAFGADDPGQTVAVIIGIGTMYACYQAPKQLMSWALSGYSGGSGILKTLVLKRL